MNQQQTVEELVRRARQAMAGQHLEDALALTLEASDLEPGDAGLLLSAGILAGQIGDLATSENCLRKSLSLNPASATAHENLAVALSAQNQAEPALMHIEKALAIRDHAETHNRHGFLLASLGRHDEAIRACQTAIDRDPAIADAHNNLGVSLQATGDTESALAAYTRAVELNPHRADTCNNRGLALQGLGRIDEAIAAHRQALDIEPNNAEFLAELARALERTNRVDEAREAADAALRQDSAQRKARLVDAVLLRREGRLEQAANHLESLLETARDNRETGEIEVELGQGLDQLGRYVDAYRYFASGQNHLLQSWASRPDPDQYLREIDTNRQWPWDNTPAERDPVAPAFLLGFPRSGTTLTGRILGAHPDVVASDEWPLIPALLKHALDEMGLTPGPLDDAQRQLLVSEYWRVAGEYGVARDGPRFLDKLPLNITRLRFLRQVFPGAAVIVALRDPRDACLSAFMQAFRPNQAMAHFTSMADAASLYTAVMADWVGHRDGAPGVLLESRYETLVQDFQPSAARLLNHLGLEWTDQVETFFRDSQGRYLSTPSYQAVTEPVHNRALSRWRNYREQISTEIKILQPFVSQFGYE